MLYGNLFVAGNRTQPFCFCKQSYVNFERVEKNYVSNLLEKISRQCFIQGSPGGYKIKQIHRGRQPFHHNQKTVREFKEFQHFNHAGQLAALFKQRNLHWNFSAVQLKKKKIYAKKFKNCNKT